MTDANHDLFQTLNAAKQALETAMLQVLLKGGLNTGMKERMTLSAILITRAVNEMKPD
jgi:hypothetical protein